MTTETSLFALYEHGDLPAESKRIGPAASEEEEVSLLDLLIVLAERRQIIFWVTGTFAVLAVIVSFLLPTRYTASITLLPPQQNSSIGAALTSQLSGMGGAGGIAALAGGALGIKNPNDMIVGMLKSRTVEDAMIQHFGLMQEYRKKYISDARKAFENRVIVDGSGKDGLIHVSVEDHDPKRAAELANGYIDQFRTQSQHLAITEASQRRLFFERELEQAKDNLANAEEALKRTEQTTGLIQADSQARALIGSASSLSAAIAAKEVEIEGMQTYATGENAQLVQAQRELEGLRAQLAKLGGSEDSPTGGLIVPKGRVPEAGLEYVRKLRDVKYNETLFEILARQFEIAKLDEAKEGSLIQVVDPAIPPDKKSFPKRSLIVIAAAIAGLIVGVGLALAQAGMGNLNSNPETNAKLLYLKRILSWRAHPAK